MNVHIKNILATGKFLLVTGIVWIGEIFVFYFLANLSIGLTIDSLATAALVIVILEIINAIFWPIIVRLLLPFLVYTIGIGSLLLNAGIIWGISLFIPSLSISVYALILVTLGIAVIHTILKTILINDEESYYSFIIRRKNKRAMGGSIVITDDYINNIRSRIDQNENNENGKEDIEYAVKNLEYPIETENEDFGLIIIEIMV